MKFIYKDFSYCYGKTTQLAHTTFIPDTLADAKLHAANHSNLFHHLITRWTKVTEKRKKEK